MPASDIGHVIGRKGETVQSMRDRSGATIKVHEGNSGAALPGQLASRLLVALFFIIVSEQVQQQLNLLWHGAAHLMLPPLAGPAQYP